MKKINSQLNTSSSEFLNNETAYKELVENLESLQNLARSPESDSQVKKLHDNGKYTLSQRISFLIDPDSSILEIGLLAGYEEYAGVPPGAGIYTAVVKVSGEKCVLIANIPSVKGGTYFPLTVKKHIRALEIALQNKLPLIYLVDSGGAFLPLQSEIFPDRYDFGRIFYLQAQASSERIPQIACVLGSCTAGGAYIPAMSEQVVMVEGNSSIFLGGPPLVKAATGEIVSSEELGGAKLHACESGVCDYIESSEESALYRVRSLVSALNVTGLKREDYSLIRERDPCQPLYDPAELYGLLDCNLKTPIDAREVIARIVDESRFEEFKYNYAPTIVCGFAYIEGYLTGIVASNGILFSESALKATHFISLCEQRRVPLLFLQNIVGFMVGKDYEKGGIAKNGAKMVTAVSTASVPKYTLFIGGSFGAGNYGMCGRAYDPNFLFTWPHSQISVMGGAQAALVLTEVKARSGKKVKKNELKKLRDEIEEQYRQKANAFYATSQLWDDGILDPKKTRETMALSFASTYFNPEVSSQVGIYRM